MDWQRPPQNQWQQPGVPPYPPYYPYYQPDPYQMFAYMQSQEKEKLKRHNNLAGFVCFGFIGASFFVAIVFGIFVAALTIGSTITGDKSSLTDTTSTAYLLMYMVEYVLMLAIPIVLGLLLCRFYLKSRDVHPIYVKRVKPSYGLSLLMFSASAIVVGNYVSTFVVNLMEQIGIAPSDIPQMQDGSMRAFLLNFLIIAVLPAILEEIMFRGLVMQSLRFAGDTIAVVVSSILFAMVHGTLYQIPFAFVLGLMLGCIALKTGNILFSMILHFFNNAMAVILEYVCINHTEEFGEQVSIIYFAVLAIVGIMGAAFLWMRPHHAATPWGDNGQHLLSLKERWKSTLFSPLIIAFIVLMAFATLLTTNIGDVDSMSDLYSYFEEQAMIPLWSLFYG